MVMCRRLWRRLGTYCNLQARYDCTCCLSRVHTPAWLSRTPLDTAVSVPHGLSYRLVQTVRRGRTTDLDCIDRLLQNRVSEFGIEDREKVYQ